MTSRVFKTVTFNLTDKGLGISIIGSTNDNNSDIFVKFVSPSGLASLDGRLQEGDQIISVNGNSLNGISCDDAVELLKNASEDGFVQLKIYRDYQARQKYKEVCEMYSFSEEDNNFVGVEGIGPALQKSSDRNLRTLLNDDVHNVMPVNNRSTRINVDTLLQSLSFLGIQLTNENQMDMKNKLNTDKEGNVEYDEFVNMAKELHSSQMTKINISHEHDNNTRFNRGSSQSLPSKKHDNTMSLVNQKNDTILILEKELSKYKNELHGLRDELKNLRNKLKLSEEAQAAARITEGDYELVLRQLEKNNNKRLNSPEVSDEIEIMKYQLRKSETSNKLLRTANEKLIDFAMFVANALKKRKEQINIHEILKKSIASPVFLDFSSSDKIILFEANQTIKAVKTLLDIEAQPQDYLPTKERSINFLNKF